MSAFFINIVLFYYLSVNMLKRFIKEFTKENRNTLMELLRRFRFTIVLMMLTTLVACGGGDGTLSRDGDGGGGPSTPVTAVALSIDNDNVDRINPAEVTATVTTDGVAQVGVVVTFSTTLGILDPESGTALTDADGKATIDVHPGNSSGAGAVSAVAIGVTSASPVGFSSAGDGDSGGIVGKTIIITSSNTNITAANPATVTVNVTKNDKNIIGELVTFTTTLGVLDPKTGTALTDANGKAIITLAAGSEKGAGLISVTTSTGELNTLGFSTEGDASEVGGNALTITSFTNSTSISNANPATITVHFEQADGTDLSNEVITLTSTLGVLAPSTGTVLTNSTGDATITLLAGAVKGAGVLTATSGSGDVVTQGFFTEGDASEVGGNALTITSFTNSTSISNANPATITVHFEQANGTDLSNKVITLTSTLGVLSPSTGTVLTNSTGDATITLSAGAVKGAGVLTATSGSGDVVTQGFFSEGDSVGTGVNISLVLTDLNGNPVDQISSISSGKLTATVTGVNKAVIVTFETDIGSIPIPTAIATTGSGYIATVDLLAGNSLGAGTVTASLVSGESEQLVFSIGASLLGMGNAIDPLTGLPDGLIGLSSSSISAGATTGLTVKIWDVDGASPASPATLFITETVEVTFSSGCSGLTTPTALIDSPVATIGGIAQSTYLAQGCEPDDVITATANAGGIILSATGTITVDTPLAGSIEFVSATPENISLKGVGGIESSTVIFRVIDTNGNVVANKEVDFSLNTEVGGIEISPENAITDANGEVQTVVNSGTVSTSVRVRAELAENASIFSQSKLLVISTGIPDQDSFSLSASTLNVEGWDIDGTEVTVTARLADAFNNPVPDGTAINFTTEGGSIEPSCTTENGVCTVIWTSQYPRPEGHVLGDINNLLHLPEEQNTMGQKYGGRVTILATAIGEESFPDLNGNGRFDECEVHAFTGHTGSNNGTGEPCNDDGTINDGSISYTGYDISGNTYDLKEAFVDHNEDGLFNPGEAGGETGGELETFVDFTEDGAFSPKDNKYNGSLCSDNNATNCNSDKQSVNVRGSLVLAMSGGNPRFSTTYPANGGSVNITSDGTASAAVIIADLHNQPMPAGTTVVFEAAVGSIVGESSFIWPNFTKNGGSSFAVTVKGVTNKTIDGPLTVTVTTPSGVATTYTVATISITP